MDIINIIDFFYKEEIENVSKFEVYKILKELDPYFTYYKLKKRFDKLIETKILIINTNKFNQFKFNKSEKIKKPSLTVSFD